MRSTVNPAAAPDEPEEPLRGRDAERLLQAIVELSHLRDLEGVAAAVRRAARALTGADGVTFVLREGDLVFYMDEEAIGPLWKGRRFPASSCISGWACVHRQSVAIEDIYADPRIPHDAYRPTFVKSLAMVPIRKEDPLGALGAYWADRHAASPRELKVLESLAGAAAVAVHNAELFKEAQRAVQVRDQFLGLASHELRTPLTPLSLQLDRVARSLAQLPPAEAGGLLESFAQARGYTRRLSRVVDRLLMVSHLEQGTLHLEPEPLELGAVLRGVVAEVQEPLARSGSALRMEVEESVEGHWDRLRLQQIAEELLSNAIKFGQGQPIEIALRREERAAQLVVADRGVGIAVEDQRRIFHRFERAAPHAHFGGLGLGLWMARQFVIAMGGLIRVESAPGAGAVFTVQLPLA